jgi:hypothetical protein
LFVGTPAVGIVDHADEIGLQFGVEDFEQVAAADGARRPAPVSPAAAWFASGQERPATYFWRGIERSKPHL